MVEDSWGALIKAGIAVLVIFAFSASAWLIFDGQRSQNIYEQHAEAEAKGYADRANIAGERRCVPLAAAEELKCKRDENETARQGRRHERDLQAQLVTSAWTRQMGVAAIVAMGFGVLGVALIFVTFRETRKAAASARDTYNAFVAVEDASLVVDFAHGTRGESHSPGKRVENYTLNAVIRNIGRSDAIVKLWRVGDEERRVDKSCSKGEPIKLGNVVTVETLEPFVFIIEYESSLRPIAVRAVTAQVRVSQKNREIVRGRILGYETRFPTEKERSKQKGA